MNQVSLNPSAVARTLGAGALLLVVASLAGQFSRFELGHDRLMGMVPLFFVDAEQNVPTYFSVLLMLFASLILALIAVLHRQERIPDAAKWAILSFGFVFMAFDEAFQVHEALETLVVPVKSFLGNRGSGALLLAWVIPAIALVFAFALPFLRFLLHLPPTTRRGFLVAATIYIGGAVVVDLVGVRYVELHGSKNWTYSMIATVEESLEMAGLIVFLWALLRYCADNYKEVRLRFES